MKDSSTVEAAFRERELNIQYHTLVLLPCAVTSITAVLFSQFTGDVQVVKMEQEAEQPVGVQGGSSGGLESDRVSRVRKLLFRQMLVGIKDGRFFLGNFYCIDKQGNIILQDTVE